jgi:hypothetical protein
MLVINIKKNPQGRLFDLTDRSKIYSEMPRTGEIMISPSCSLPERTEENRLFSPLIYIIKDVISIYPNSSKLKISNDFLMETISEAEIFIEEGEK